jgi:hypothetical protein
MGEEMEIEAAATGAGRFDELRAAVDKVKIARRSIDRRKALLLAGSILVPLGLLLILVGWYGVAHNPYLFEQLPYVVSGGILGLALTFVGGFVYFAHWILRLADQDHEDALATNERLERIEALLAEQIRLTTKARGKK